MAAEISTERVGVKVYITGNTYAIRDQLKRAGCHWDGDRRQWWIGVAKADAIASLVSQVASGPPASENLDDARVQGKVAYKGKNYFCIGRSRDGSRLHLVSLDAKIDFWADLGRCETVRDYPPREYRGRIEYTTIGSLRRFVERERANRRAGGGVCAECGKGGDLVRDLEDGQMKHRGCCDIEP